MSDNDSPKPEEISEEKKAMLEPWIEEFETFDLTGPERISILFGMALACCVKEGLDFNALLGATILAEQSKQVTEELKPEDS